MIFEVWLAFAIASAAVCFTPGPTTLFVLSQVLKHGKKSVFALIAGVELGNLVAMGLSFLGLGAVLVTSAALFTVLKFLGAGYLIYLGVMTIRNRNKRVNFADNKTSTHSIFKSIFVVTALNPKSIVFFIAFFPLFISSEASIIPQMVLLVLSFALVSISSVITYAVFSNVLRNKITSAAFREKINKTSGGLLIGAGVVVASVNK